MPPTNVPLIESVLVASTEIVAKLVSVPTSDSKLPLAVIVPMLTTIPLRVPPDQLSVPLFVNPPEPPVSVPPENWLLLPAAEIAPLPPSDPLARIKFPAMVKGCADRDGAPPGAVDGQVGDREGGVDVRCRVLRF